MMFSNSMNFRSSVRYGVPLDDASSDSRSIMTTLDMDDIEVIGLGGGGTCQYQSPNLSHYPLSYEEQLGPSQNIVPVKNQA